MQIIKSFITQIKIGIISPSLLRLTRQMIKSKKTFLDYPRLLSLIDIFQMVRKRHNAELQIAEFGVGRGGSAILLAWLIKRYGGKLTLFDVFGRIPAPSPIDGEEAQIRFEKIKGKEKADYYGNIPDLIDVLKQDLETVCDLEQIEFVQGKYEDTLPQLTLHRSYNLAHIDCDWYLSAKTVLDYLQNHLAQGGVLQIDDYAYWSGAKKATDEATWLKAYVRHMVSGALVIDTAKIKKN